MQQGSLTAKSRIEGPKEPLNNAELGRFVPDISPHWFGIGLLAMIQGLFLSAGGLLRPAADTLRPLRDQPFAMLVEINQRECRQ